MGWSLGWETEKKSHVHVFYFLSASLWVKGGIRAVSPPQISTLWLEKNTNQWQTVLPNNSRQLEPNSSGWKRNPRRGLKLQAIFHFGDCTKFPHAVWVWYNTMNSALQPHFGSLPSQVRPSALRENPGTQEHCGLPPTEVQCCSHGPLPESNTALVRSTQQRSEWNRGELRSSGWETSTLFTVLLFAHFLVPGRSLTRSYCISYFWLTVW